MGTLYVGGLDPTVIDTHLFEVFNAVVPVSSARVCRDRETSKSLGNGYVNFQSVADGNNCFFLSLASWKQFVIIFFRLDRGKY